MYSLRTYAQVGHPLRQSFYQRLLYAVEHGPFSCLLLMSILWRAKEQMTRCGLGYVRWFPRRSERRRGEQQRLRRLRIRRRLGKWPTLVAVESRWLSHRRADHIRARWRPRCLCCLCPARASWASSPLHRHRARSAAEAGLGPRCIGCRRHRLAADR